MRPPRITEAVARFELSTQPDCDAYGWDAWPLIRCWLALAQAEAGGSWSHDRSAMMSVVPWGARSLLKAPAWALQNRGAGLSKVPTEQVAIITRADRVQILEGRNYHYLADPIVHMLASDGFKAAVWQRDQPRLPAWHPAFHCEVPLSLGATLREVSGRVRRIRKAPPWFADIATWHREVFGSELPWHAVSWVLRSAEAMRQTYEGWFRRAGTSLVLTDAWYGVTTMAAILAARSVGIPAIDLQHGSQGAGHFAYSGWSRSDYTRRMCPFPNGFWVWGAHDAIGLEKNNQGVLDSECVFAAGYPWLNEWLDPSDDPLREADMAAARLVDGRGKVILVTLQLRQHIEEILQLASLGPPEWLWLIRVHRKWREASAEVETKARKRGLVGRVESVQATELPLYAVMRRSNVHVTWYSTCALEATAFAVPTVLLDRIAEVYYSDYLDSGLMRLALDQTDAVKDIADAPWNVSPERLDVPEPFSKPAVARAEMQRMLSIFDIAPSA